MHSITFADPLVRSQTKVLERLVLDLARIRRGEAPTPLELSGAPLIEDWQMATRPAAALYGTVTDHPYLATGTAMTSEIWILDPAAGYCRTFSRWYRLGAPASDVS